MTEAMSDQPDQYTIERPVDEADELLRGLAGYVDRVIVDVSTGNPAQAKDALNRVTAVMDQITAEADIADRPLANGVDNG